MSYEILQIKLLHSFNCSIYFGSFSPINTTSYFDKAKNKKVATISWMFNQTCIFSAIICTSKTDEKYVQIHTAYMVFQCQVQ